MRVLLLHMSRIDGLTKINTVSSRLVYSSNLIILYYYLVLMKSIHTYVSTGCIISLYVTDAVAKSSGVPIDHYCSRFDFESRLYGLSSFTSVSYISLLKYAAQ